MKFDDSTKLGRKKLIDYCNHDAYLEGINLSDNFRLLQDRYIRGEITLEEMKELLLGGFKSNNTQIIF